MECAGCEQHSPVTVLFISRPLINLHITVHNQTLDIAAAFRYMDPEIHKAEFNTKFGDF